MASTDYTDLTDDQIQKLIDLGEIPSQQDFLGQQLKQANALRNQPLDQGQMYGRVHTAATPLGMAGSVASRVMAGSQASDIQNQMQANLVQQSTDRKAYFDMIRDQHRQMMNPQAPGAGTMQNGDNYSAPSGGSL